MLTKINKWDKNIPVEKSVYLHEEDYTVINNPEIQIEENKLTMIDLFCGAGGFSVGAKWAGFKSLMGVDYLKPAIETWKTNHPDAIAILGDIKKLTGNELKEMLNGINIDLITGGVPCQGFSRSNRKHKTDDERNFLFLDFMRIVEVFKPKAIIIENVGAIRSRGEGKFEKEILAAMEEAGYKGVVKTLNAAEYGVPQIRERAFFIGLKNGLEFKFPNKKFTNKLKNQNLFEEELLPFRTVYNAISDLPKINSHEEAHQYEYREELTEFQKLMRGIDSLLEKEENKILYNHVAPKHDKKTLERIRCTEPGKSMYENFKQRIRLSYDKPSPTQLAGGIRPQFQFGHPELIRGLTIRERARIQSFPDSYIFTGGTVQERVQTGNAVPPLLVYEILKELKKYL